MSESSNQPNPDQPVAATAIPQAPRPTPPNPSDSPERQNPTPAANREAGCGGCAIYSIIILMTTFGGSIFGLICQSVLNSKPTYQSTAKVMIEPRTSSGNIDLGSGGNRLEIGYQITDHHKLMTAKEFVHEVLEMNDYYKLSTFANMSQDDALEKAVKSLSVKPDPEEPTVYEMHFLAHHEEESKLLLNSLLVAYQEYLVETYRDQQNRFAANFKKTTNKIIARFEKANEEYEALRDKYPTVDLESGTSLSQQNLKLLDEELSRDRKRALDLEGKTKWVMDALEAGLKEIEIIWILCNQGEIDFRLAPFVPASDAMIGDIQANISNLKLDLAKLQSNGEADQQEIKDVENQIGSWESILKKNDDRMKSPRFGSITTQTMIRLYLHQIAQQRLEIQKMLETNVKRYADLHKQVKSEKDGAYLLKRKEEEIEQISGWLRQAQTVLAEIDPDQLDSLKSVNKQGYRFKVLERAEDGTPYRPRLSWWFIGGAFSGLVFGMLICLIIQSAKSPRRT